MTPAPRSAVAAAGHRFHDGKACWATRVPSFERFTGHPIDGAGGPAAAGIDVRPIVVVEPKTHRRLRVIDALAAPTPFNPSTPSTARCGTSGNVSHRHRSTPTPHCVGAPTDDGSTRDSSGSLTGNTASRIRLPWRARAGRRAFIGAHPSRMPDRVCENGTRPRDG